MIQLLPYQFEPELFTNLRFTLLRNAVQPLILILSHRNCHAWSNTKTNMHQSAIYRTTNGYMFRIPGIPHRHGQISTLRKVVSKTGIKSKQYKNLLNTYCSVKACVRTNDGLTDFFIWPIGLKQGCWPLQYSSLMNLL